MYTQQVELQGLQAALKGIGEDDDAFGGVSANQDKRPPCHSASAFF
jgi:hypothetical protein